MFSFFKKKKSAAPAAPQPTEAPAQQATPASGSSWFGKLTAGLSRTRQNLFGGLRDLIGGKAIDAALLNELEDRLLLADVGVEATQKILSSLRGRHREQRLNNAEELLAALRSELLALLPVAAPAHPLAGTQTEIRPQVILTVGVNGAGKTTTLGKLAAKLARTGQQVMLAAGDTFRAAAIEQLQTWGVRANVPVIAQATGADPASVIYDALASAQAKGVDVLLADTAGRLHTREGLMDELKKIKRVLAKLDASAPHQVLLVLDATQGQNALTQAREFHAAIGITGIVLTKLDGTAKGGIVFAIAQQLQLPIRYIGVGEQVDDLREFEPAEFVDALLAGSV